MILIFYIVKFFTINLIYLIDTSYFLSYIKRNYLVDLLDVFVLLYRFAMIFTVDFLNSISKCLSRFKEMSASPRLQKIVL